MTNERRHDAQVFSLDWHGRVRPATPCSSRLGSPTQQSVSSDATDSTILLEIDGPIATVTLNRSDRLDLPLVSGRAPTDLRKGGGA
jgi:hypothetical protein